mgnify:CR=1 FL=1
MKVQLTHTIKRNNKVIATKGDIIPEKKAIQKKINPRYYVVLNSKQTEYTREEVEVIVKSYLRNDSRVSVMTEFFEVYPDTRHTPDSVMIMGGQLEKIDNTKPGGDYHLTQLLIDVAKSISPSRFS